MDIKILLLILLLVLSGCTSHEEKIQTYVDLCVELVGHTWGAAPEKCLSDAKRQTEKELTENIKHFKKVKSDMELIEKEHHLLIEACVPYMSDRAYYSEMTQSLNNSTGEAERISESVARARCVSALAVYGVGSVDKTFSDIKVGAGEVKTEFERMKICIDLETSYLQHTNPNRTRLLDSSVFRSQAYTKCRNAGLRPPEKDETKWEAFRSLLENRTAAAVSLYETMLTDPCEFGECMDSCPEGFTTELYKCDTGVCCEPI